MLPEECLFLFLFFFRLLPRCTHYTIPVFPCRKIRHLEWNCPQQIDQSRFYSWHLSLFPSSAGPKLYDRQRLSSTHFSWQAPSDSSSVSSITLPRSLRPLISVAKFTACKSSVYSTKSWYQRYGQSDWGPEQEHVMCSLSWMLTQSLTYALLISPSNSRSTHMIYSLLWLQ